MKSIKNYLWLVAIIFSTSVKGQNINPFYLGHSLINFDIPNMTHKLAIDAQKTTTYNTQIMNGATLMYQYQNPSQAQGMPYTTAFPNGQFNAFIVTEAVPLMNHITWSNTYEFANLFYQYANANNNNIAVKYYLYETWHCINTGTLTGCDWDNEDSLAWIPRLQDDFQKWTAIVNHVRTNNPTGEIYLIPAGQAFVALNQEIVNGQIPGISSYTQFFSDDIHLNNLGKYFVSCVMYATLWGETPVGLTSNMTNQWDVLYTDMPTPQQAQIFQQVAWNVVSSIPEWTNVQNLSNQDFEKITTKVYPNPATNFITIKTNEVFDTYKILDLKGRTILSAKYENAIDISSFTEGIYILNLDKNGITETYKIVKK